MQDNNYGNYAEIANLIINHVEMKNLSTTFTDFSALYNWMQAVTLHCSQLPVTDCRKLFIQAVAEKYRRKVPARSAKDNFAYIFHDKFILLDVSKPRLV